MRARDGRLPRLRASAEAVGLRVGDRVAACYPRQRDARMAREGFCRGGAAAKG